MSRILNRLTNIVSNNVEVATSGFTNNLSGLSPGDTAQQAFNILDELASGSSDFLGYSTTYSSMVYGGSNYVVLGTNIGITKYYLASIGVFTQITATSLSNMLTANIPISNTNKRWLVFANGQFVPSTSGTAEFNIGLWNSLGYDSNRSFGPIQEAVGLNLGKYITHLSTPYPLSGSGVIRFRGRRITGSFAAVPDNLNESGIYGVEMVDTDNIGTLLRSVNDLVVSGSTGASYSTYGTINFTTGARRCLILWDGYGRSQSTTAFSLDNGAEVAALTCRYGANFTYSNAYLTPVLTAGSHNIRLRARSASASVLDLTSQVKILELPISDALGTLNYTSQAYSGNISSTADIANSTITVNTVSARRYLLIATGVANHSGSGSVGFRIKCDGSIVGSSGSNTFEVNSDSYGVMAVTPSLGVGTHTFVVNTYISGAGVTVSNGNFIAIELPAIENSALVTDEAEITVNITKPSRYNVSANIPYYLADLTQINGLDIQFNISGPDNFSKTFSYPALRSGMISPMYTFDIQNTGTYVFTVSVKTGGSVFNFPASDFNVRSV